jgi:flagellin-like hook-associated protein FlgL
MNLDVTLDGVNSLSIDLLNRNLFNSFADFEIARPIATLTLISVTPPAGGNAGDITFLPSGELSISSTAVQGETYAVRIEDIYGWNRATGIIDININSANENSSSTISSKINTANLFSSNARRVTTEIIPTYGDSLVSEASTEFNLTETPSFTMELSNFELLKNFSETFEGGTFNLSGLDVSNVSINQQTGELLLSSLDFENPNDSDSNNVYEFVINYEANGNIFIQNVKINILDVALPDMIPATTTVEATEAQSISINAPGTHELSTEFLEYVSQNQGGVFSLRGTDGSLSNLSINSATGEINANNLSFETPLDADTNNSYEFVIEYCVNEQRVQENIILNIGDVGGEISSIGEVTKNVNYQSLIIHPYFQLNGETTSFFTNVASQVLDAGVVPRIAPMLEEFVNQNPGGTYTLTGLAGSGTLTYGIDFIVDSNSGEFIFDENQLSLADMGDYTMRLEYSSGSGNFIQDLTFLNLRTHSVDGVSDNTIQTNTGTVSVDFVTGEDDLIIDVVGDANNFPYIEAFYSAFSSHSADGLGNVLITNLRRNGESYAGGITVSNTGLLTLSNDLQPGTYTFSFETRGRDDTMFTVTGPTELILDFTVTVANGDAVNSATKTVSSTSPTTPPVLTKVGQQGLATRLDYQITEARGFKVHAPEDVGDREELKKFIDVNSRGTFALSGADAEKFTVDSDGMIKSQSQIDYERQSSYEFELTYTSGGASYKESYFLTVVDDPADNVKHLRDIGVGTRASSAEAVEILNVALDQLTSSRAKLGAIENRLTYNISNLTKASMLTDQASGRITDTNFAQETSKLAKNQILNQASMAMLSQANQSKQNVLQLLG